MHIRQNKVEPSNHTFAALICNGFCSNCNWLWFLSFQVPKAGENFIRLCKKGYYDGTIFHRSIRNFMVRALKCTFLLSPQLPLYLKLLWQTYKDLERLVCGQNQMSYVFHYCFENTLTKQDFKNICFVVLFLLLSLLSSRMHAHTVLDCIVLAFCTPLS